MSNSKYIGKKLALENELSEARVKIKQASYAMYVIGGLYLAYNTYSLILIQNNIDNYHDMEVLFLYVYTTLNYVVGILFIALGKGTVSYAKRNILISLLSYLGLLVFQLVMDSNLFYNGIVFKGVIVLFLSVGFYFALVEKKVLNQLKEL